MKEKFIEDIHNMQEGDVFQSFCMVKKAEIKLGSNKKQYMDLTLSDNTGDINGKKWEITPEDIAIIEELKPGTLIKVRANVNVWNGMSQLKLTKLRLGLANDNLDLQDFIRKAPEDSEAMYEFLLERASEIKDEDLRKLTLLYLEREKERLIYYPAAKSNHHAIYGGLLYHMKRMLMAGDALCKVYTNLDPDLVAAGVILHDMEKLNEIKSNEMGISDGYTFEGNMLGHLVMGVRELEKVMTELNFSREKATMIQHMILSHHYAPEFGSPRRPMFPEAEILHYLDIVDARMYDMAEVLSNTKPGEFSEKVFVLDNRLLYKKEEI